MNFNQLIEKIENSTERLEEFGVNTIHFHRGKLTICIFELKRFLNIANGKRITIKNSLQKDTYRAVVSLSENTIAKSGLLNKKDLEEVQHELNKRK